MDLLTSCAQKRGHIGRLGGFSLVELMIALTLGLMLTMGLYSMLSSQRLTYQMSQLNGSITERAQRDNNFLRAMVNQAGYMDYDSVQSSILGDTPFIKTGSWVKGQVIRADNNLTSASMKSGSDMLQLRFIGDGALIYNCAGNVVSAQMLWYVSIYVNSNSQLICSDTNSTTVLDENVETLQLLFTSSTTPSTLLRADEVTSASAWLTVTRLSYGLLLAEKNVAAASGINTQSYQILDQSINSANDSQLRQPITESLLLRNNRS